MGRHMIVLPFFRRSFYWWNKRFDREMFDQSVRIDNRLNVNAKKNFLLDKRSRSVQFLFNRIIYYFMHEILLYIWIIYHFITEMVYYIMHGYKFRFEYPYAWNTAPSHDSGSHSCSIWKRAEFYWIMPYCYGMRGPIFKFLKIKKKLNILFQKSNWFFTWI